MELNNSYYLNEINTLTGHSPINTNNQSIEAENASVKFSSLFFERVLNTANSEVSLITGEEKSSGEIFATQLLNQNLSEVITKNSEIKERLKKLLEKQNNVIR